MDIGAAVMMAKRGARIARTGWNGKEQYVYYVHAAEYPTTTNSAKAEFGAMAPYRAYMAIKTTDGDVVPWTASQSDLLAEDWRVVPYPREQMHPDSEELGPTGDGPLTEAENNALGGAL
jgi:hypothetical protein